MLLADEGQVSKAECTCAVLPQAGAQGRAVRPPGRAAAGLRRAGGASGRRGRRRAQAVTVETRTYSRRDAGGRGRLQVSLERQRLKVRWGRAGQPMRLQTLRSTRSTTRGRPTSPASASWTPAASSTRRRSEHAEHEPTHDDANRLTQPTSSILWRPSCRPAASRRTSRPSSRERGFLVERRETDGMSRARAGGLQEVAQGRGRGAPQAQARGVAGLPGQPHRPPRRGRLLERRSAAPTSGTCPTPRSAPPRTSCRRSTRRSSSPRPWA